MYAFFGVADWAVSVKQDYMIWLKWINAEPWKKYKC